MGYQMNFFMHIVLYKLDRVSMLQSFKVDECNFNIFLVFMIKVKTNFFFIVKTFLNDVIIEVKDELCNDDVEKI